MQGLTLLRIFVESPVIARFWKGIITPIVLVMKHFFLTWAAHLRIDSLPNFSLDLIHFSGKWLLTPSSEIFSAANPNTVDDT